MNQILSTGDNKKRKDVNIKSIIKFFSIFLIIFAVCIIVVVVFGIINKGDKTNNQKPIIKVTPSLEEKILNIEVTDDKGIDKIIYVLNEEETELKIDGELKKEIVLDLEDGDNTFKISVIDTDGAKNEIQELYEVKEDKKGKVEVGFMRQGNEVKVSVTSENEISYITYRWDEQEETKETVENTEYELNVEMPEEEGKYKLTVNVVDKNNNTEEKTMTLIKDSKPTIELSATNEEFIIKAKDDEKLLRAEITLNGETLEEIEINDKKWEYKLPYADKNGINRLKVVVYNLNEISEEAKAQVDASKLTND